jgi:hypothetical protein
LNDTNTQNKPSAGGKLTRQIGFTIDEPSFQGKKHKPKSWGRGARGVVVERRVQAQCFAMLLAQRRGKGQANKEECRTRKKSGATEAHTLARQKVHYCRMIELCAVFEVVRRESKMARQRRWGKNKPAANKKARHRNSIFKRRRWIQKCTHKANKAYAHGEKPLFWWCETSKQIHEAKS